MYSLCQIIIRNDINSMHEETVRRMQCSISGDPDAETLRVEYLHLENKTNATPFHFNQKSCDHGKMHNNTTQPHENPPSVCAHCTVLTMHLACIAYMHCVCKPVVGRRQMYIFRPGFILSNIPRFVKILHKGCRLCGLFLIQSKGQNCLWSQKCRQQGHIPQADIPVCICR